MTYDSWKAHNPIDDCCEFCGAGPNHKGWRPDSCTGECGLQWRDPDAEYDRMRDERL